MHGDLRDQGEGAAHAVGVHHRKPHPSGPGHGDQAVAAADLARHERGDAPAGEVLQVMAEPGALVPVLDLLDADRGGADAAARHDQAVVREFVQVDQRDGAVVLGRLQGLEQGEVRVTAAAGAEHRAATCHRTQRGRIQQAFHNRD